MPRFSIVMACLALVVLTGCGHYRVTDVQTGTVYYTQDLHQSPDGVVAFNDVVTGNAMILQYPNIQSLTDKEFKEQVAQAKAMTPPSDPWMQQFGGR